ncbi:MAG TPA: hypothetical protein V6D33_13460 [Cyanophyceae cyanobacterium]
MYIGVNTSYLWFYSGHVVHYKFGEDKDVNLLFGNSAIADKTTT